MLELISTENLVYLGILAGVFVSVCAFVAGIRSLVVSRNDPVRSRLARTVASIKLKGQTPEAASTQKGQSLAQLALKPFAGMARPRNPEELGRLRQRLNHAGLRSEQAAIIYLGVKALTCLVFGLAFVWINAVRPQPLAYSAFWTLLVLAFGYYLPNLWLDARIRQRKTALRHALPDALDLMVTCVEAGLGLDGTLNRVAEEIAISAPLLSQELKESALEMKAGVLRRDAFRRMAERCGVEEISQLAAIIYQTEVFGTSVAQALRVQAEFLRVQRMQRAEERAATVAVKLAFPLIFNILPALMAVLLGPAVLRFIRTLLPKLMGD